MNNIVLRFLTACLRLKILLSWGMLTLAMLLSLAVTADTSMVYTGDAVYTMHKKKGKIIITTTTTTTIYEKKSRKPGVIKKIITKTRYVNDRKNKKSSTETKVTRIEQPLKSGKSIP